MDKENETQINHQENSRMNNNNLSKLIMPTDQRRPISPNPEIFSPVTCLALDLNQLNTHSGGTPKRRLSLDSTGTPTPVRSLVRPSFCRGYPRTLSSTPSDAGCCLDSPVFIDTPTRNQRFSDLLKLGSEKEKDQNQNEPPYSSAFRRVQSLPVQNVNSPMSADFFPKHKEEIKTLHEESSLIRPAYLINEDSNSQDSGVCDLKDRKEDDFEFVKPTLLPRRRTSSRSSSGSITSPLCSPRRGYQHINEDTCSPKHYSSSYSRPISAPRFSLPDSPEGSDESPTLMTSSLTSSMNDDEGDDGFLDVMSQENTAVSTCLSSGMRHLISGPLVDSETEMEMETETSLSGNRLLTSVTSVRRSSCRARNLFRSPSMPQFHHSQDSPASSFIRRRSSYKRPDPPRDHNTPKQNKRRRAVLSACENTIQSPNCPSRIWKLEKRCQSATEETIKSALSKVHDDPDLVGDTSSTYCLPTVPGKQQDLKSITPDTIINLLNGLYSDVIEKFTIVDCRYPYEYKGGHIKGGQNIYQKEKILENFLKKDIIKTQDPQKRHIVIFHCEFSSERAPKLCRFLRNKDRDANKDHYPNLHYPELYILDGGYQNFFENQKVYCEPQSYKLMLDTEHTDDLKHFRTKSKSWAGERPPTRVGLKW